MAELVVGIDTSEKLPDGYTRLEYIQSSGTQWIEDTTLVNNFVTGAIEVKLDLSCSNNGRFVGFTPTGSATSDRYTIFSSLAVITSNHDIAMCYSNYSQWNDKTDNNIDLTKVSVVKYEFASGLQKLYIDGVYNKESTFTASPTATNYTFKMFKIHKDDGYQANARVYYAKVYKGTELVRHYIPAKNSNNELGMYELLTDRFLTNKGSGTFTAGPEYIPNIQYARVPALVVEKSAPIKKYNLYDRVKDDSNNEIGTVSGFFTKNVEGHNLPDTYQELEYVELNHAYIDTGIVLDTAEKINTAKIHFTIANLPLSSGNTFAEEGHSNHLFGCKETINGVAYDLVFFTGSQSNKETYYGIRYCTSDGSQFTINYDPHDSNKDPRFLNKYRFDIDNLQMSVTDVDRGIVLGTGTASSVSIGFTDQIRINGQNRYPSTDPWYAESYNIARIYDLEIEGIAHMVPAKRNSDNVVGMYDIIRDQFYTQTSTTGYSTAAVAGPYVIPDNMEYAVVCLDAKDRTTSTNKVFNDNTTKMVGIPTLNHTDSISIYDLPQTATDNTNAIKTTAESKGALSTWSPAVYFCRTTLQSFTIDGVVYRGQIPNAAELSDIMTIYNTINSLDPTASSYYNLTIKDNQIIKSSTQKTADGSVIGHVSELAHGILNMENNNSTDGLLIPVLEIPNIIE